MVGIIARLVAWLILGIIRSRGKIIFMRAEARLRAWGEYPTLLRRCALLLWGCPADSDQEHAWAWKHHTIRIMLNNLLTSGSRVGYLPLGVINIVTSKFSGIDYITRLHFFPSSSSVKP